MVELCKLIDDICILGFFRNGFLSRTVESLTVGETVYVLFLFLIKGKFWNESSPCSIDVSLNRLFLNIFFVLSSNAMFGYNTPFDV